MTTILFCTAVIMLSCIVVIEIGQTARFYIREAREAERERLRAHIIELESDLGIRNPENNDDGAPLLNLVETEWFGIGLHEIPRKED